MSIESAFREVEGLLVDDAVPASYESEPVEIDPKDLTKADGHLRAITRITRDRDDFVEVAQAEITRLQDAVAAREAAAAEQVAWHAAVLERFHQAVLVKAPNRLSIKLPHGTLKSVQQQPEWEWEEGGAIFQAWCVENRPDLLADQKPAPPRAVVVKDAKKALTQDIVDDNGKVIGKEYGRFADGSVPPGVTVTERGRKYDYELKGDRDQVVDD